MISSQDLKTRVGTWLVKIEQVNWENTSRRSLV